MRPIILLSALALAACATAPDSPGPVALEETQRVAGLDITPLKVVDDSRCPDGVQCVWAGRVVVRVEIEGDGFSTLERDLTLGAPADIDGRTIVLDGVEPRRNAGTIVSDAAYRFHFSVTPR